MAATLLPTYPGPQVTYRHTACPPLGSQACRSTCRRWVCSDTAHQHGSHLALGYTHPHLRKNTASTWKGVQAVRSWLSLSTSHKPTHSTPPAPTLRGHPGINHTMPRPISRCTVLGGITHVSLTGLQDSVQICLLLEVSHDPLKSGRCPHHMLPCI